MSLYPSNLSCLLNIHFIKISKDTASYQHGVYSSRYLSELCLLFMSSQWKRYLGPIRSTFSYHETRAEFPPISISFALDQWKNIGLTEKKAPRGCVILSTFEEVLLITCCVFAGIAGPCVVAGWLNLTVDFQWRGLGPVLTLLLHSV